MKKKWVLLFKCLASLLFLALLVLHVEWDRLLEKARDVEVLYLGLSILFSFLMVAASTWKWRTILCLQNRPIPFLLLYRWYFIGYFYSNFLPSNVGGDVARAWLSGRHTGSQGVAIVSIFAERFTGLIFLLAAAVVMPLIRPALWSHPAVWVGSAIGAAGLLVLGLLSRLGTTASRSGESGRAMDAIQRKLGFAGGDSRQALWDRFASRLARLSSRLGELWNVLCRQPGALAKVASLTLLFYLMMIVNVALAYRAFGTWPDLAGVAAVFPASLLVAMLPVTLGNLGIAEGSYVFYFGLVGMGGELTLAMGLLLRMKILLLGLVGLLVHLREPLPRHAAETSPGQEMV